MELDHDVAGKELLSAPNASTEQNFGCYDVGYIDWSEESQKKSLSLLWMIYEQRN